MRYVILIIIYISVIADAWRDKLIPELLYKKYGEWTPVQWQYHLVKWLSMFSLWILLSYIWFHVEHYKYEIGIFCIFAGICSLTWKWIYNR